MEKRKQNLIPIILVSLSCLLFLIVIVLMLNTEYFKFTNKTENKENSKNEIKEETNDNKVEYENSGSNQIEDNQNINKEEINDNKVENESSGSNQNTNIEENENIEFNQPIIVEEPNKEINDNQDNTFSKNESNIVSYFESQNNMLTENVNQEDGSLRQKAKDVFVTVVDFIFYDKEIKGYTFKELTTAAKLKIIKLALSIDYKIDEYFPDYKEVIKDKYTNIKGKLAVKYLEFTSTLCESVGENTCNQAKEDFNTMKESFGFTWQLIKELASSGSSKVKEFYESWRDSE